MDLQNSVTVTNHSQERLDLFVELGF
jgi:hypothetical protein